MQCGTVRCRLLRKNIYILFPTDTNIMFLEAKVLATYYNDENQPKKSKISRTVKNISDKLTKELNITTFHKSCHYSFETF